MDRRLRPCAVVKNQMIVSGYRSLAQFPARARKRMPIFDGGRSVKTVETIVLMSTSSVERNSVWMVAFPLNIAVITGSLGPHARHT